MMPGGVSYRHGPTNQIVEGSIAVCIYPQDTPDARVLQDQLIGPGPNPAWGSCDCRMRQHRCRWQDWAQPGCPGFQSWDRACSPRGDGCIFGHRPILEKGSRFVLRPRLVRRPDPLLFFKPTHPAFQAHFRQAARSANHNSLWFTSPQTTSLIRSYFFSGFRYLSPIIRHVLTFRMACST